MLQGAIPFVLLKALLKYSHQLVHAHGPRDDPTRLLVAGDDFVSANFQLLL